MLGGGMMETVEAAVREVLALAPGEPIDVDRPFAELGFDSLCAVELGRCLHLATGVELPVTAGFDYPTPAMLAGHLEDVVAGREPA